jgi:elongation factor P--(R)-beta-lysine ligase
LFPAVCYKMNPKKQNLILRSKIIQAIRRFFLEDCFVEIETPCLVPSPGMEPHLTALEVSCTRPDGVPIQRYLHTSPEYAMKKLLGDGWEKIFQICRVFRDGEIGSTHQIEFTMLEWYRANADYLRIMEDCERLLGYVAAEVFGKREISYQGKTIDLTPPFERLKVSDALRTYGKVDIETNRDAASILNAARSRGYRFEEGADYSFDDVFFKVFLEAVEPRLGIPKPAILYDYPAGMAALARMKPGAPEWAERFELYISGLELANAFSELNDPEEQRKRFQEEQRIRAELGRPVYPLDEELLSALSRMPPSAGIALGVDRLVMFFCDTPDIRDIVAFPML